MDEILMGKFFGKNKRAIISIFSAIALIICSFSQVRSEISEAELFEKAYRAYLSYRPENSLEQFTAFLKEYPASSARDAALYWKAKSLIQLKRTEEAYQILLSLEKEFPESVFRNFAQQEIVLMASVSAQPEGAVSASTEAVAGKTIPSGDIRTYEQEMRELTEKNMRLEREVSELLRKNELSEKGLARALDERNSFEMAVNAERKKNEELVRRAEKDASSEAAFAKLAEERSALEKRLADSALLIKSYEDQIEKNKISIDLLKKEKGDSLARIKELESSHRQMEEYGELRKAASDKIIALEKERENLLENLRELESENKALGKDKNRLEVLLKEKSGEIAELSQELNQRISAEMAQAIWAEEQKSLNSSLKASEQKIYTVEEERDALEKRVAEIEKARDKALDRVKELEVVRAQQEIILADIGDKQNNWREMDQYVKDLLSKNQELESSLKAERQKTERLSSVESEKENLRVILQDIQAAQLEMDRMNRLYGDQLKDKDKEIQRLQSALSEALKSTEALSNETTELAGLRRDYDNVRNEYAALQKRSEKEREELSSLRDVMNQYENPLFSIGDKKFSLPHVIKGSMVSGNVLDKMNVEFVPWKTGNAYEDFITEEVLFGKAQEKGLKPRRVETKELADKYKMNRDEQEYLAKFLAVSEFVNSKLGNSAVKELEVRQYYDDHKDEYIRSIGEKRVKILSLPYSSEDEIEKALLVVELHGAAKQGISFENLYNSNSRTISFKEMNFNDLPPWIQSKTRNLKSGDISDIISSENSFLLIRVEAPRITYRDFDDVKKEIWRILMSRAVVDSQNFFDWLVSMRKESLNIR